MSEQKSTELTIAVMQANPHLGNVKANFESLCQKRKRAAEMGADCLLTPEMYLAGYPADDLVLRQDFMSRIEKALQDIAELSADGGPAVIVGAPYRNAGRLFNSVFLIAEGAIQARRDKVNLPNYGVFDDKRNFTAGALHGPVNLKGWRLGLAVCEDIWFEDVCETLAESGADIILSVNASPFDVEKAEQRLVQVVSRITETDLPLIYANMVGGQDELVFDGGSFALNRAGKLACQFPYFSEHLSCLTLRRVADDVHLTGPIVQPDGANEALWRALMLGLRDYCDKNGFPSVIFGLSGGIDSAIVAALAVDALGADRVHAVMMPSDYTAEISVTDADKLAEALGIKLDTIAIRKGMTAFDNMLAPSFEGQNTGLAEENIQSRLRGMLLMALSNKFGHLVLATGNKSEYAAGYSTLYGDMCGGFAPIKDVWKTRIFELARWRNSAVPKGALGPTGEVIPDRIITRPPSAELRPDQQDTDSLPPYEILDEILIALTEEMADIETITARGFDADTVAQASQLLFRAEYKRFQAAPGPKVTARAFGRDRRLPLTSGFRPQIMEKL